MLENMNDTNFRILINKVRYGADMFSAYVYEENYKRNCLRCKF